MNDLLQQAVIEATEARDRSDWILGANLYQKLVRAEPMVAGYWHNLGLCCLGLADAQRAIDCAERALQLEPRLWQSQIVTAKALKQLDQIESAEAIFLEVISAQPDNADARLGLADLALNEFGDPLGAVEWVAPLASHTDHAADAELTNLMASLYDRDFDARTLVDRIKSYARKTLQLPVAPISVAGQRLSRSDKKRVGLISPQFCASPVYFLTIGFFRELANTSELLFFSRGTRFDWATEQFRQIATDWHDLQNVDALSLAQFIATQEVDEIYDLGGWMDPTGLRALSLKPAAKQFKWVGGQSVTTGLQCFDGWIGDRWHCPDEFQQFYTEPLINTAEDYARYTPPPYLPKPATRKSSDLAIFANPAKLSRAFMQALKSMPGRKCFIHRQYRHARVQERIRDDLGRKNVSFVLPGSHEEALSALNKHATVIDTFPYSSGLTAREAIAMNTRVHVLQVGNLFCERHTARYAL